MRRGGEISRKAPGQEEFARKLNAIAVDGIQQCGMDRDGCFDSVSHRAIYMEVRQHLASIYAKRNEFWDIGKTVEELILTQGEGAAAPNGEQYPRSSIARAVKHIFGQVVDDYDQRRNRFAPLGSSESWDFHK